MFLWKILNTRKKGTCTFFNEIDIGLSKEYEKIKEDLEMFQSKRLAREIEKARKEVKRGEMLTLEELERKLNL